MPKIDKYSKNGDYELSIISINSAQVVYLLEYKGITMGRYTCYFEDSAEYIKFDIYGFYKKEYSSGPLFWYVLKNYRVSKSYDSDNHFYDLDCGKVLNIFKKVLNLNKQNTIVKKDSNNEYTIFTKEVDLFFSYIDG